MSNRATNMNSIAVKNRIAKAQRLVTWITAGVGGAEVLKGTHPVNWQGETWELINKLSGEKAKSISKLTTMTVLTLLACEGIEVL